MKTFVTVLLAAVFLASSANGSELKLEYRDGWGPDYVFEANFDTGKMKLTSSGVAVEAEFINHANVGLYVAELLKIITADPPPNRSGDDIPVFNISYIDEESEMSLIVTHVYSPSAIYLNEGFAPEDAIDNTHTYAQHAYARVLTSMLEGMISQYLGEKMRVALANESGEQAGTEPPVNMTNAIAQVRAEAQRRGVDIESIEAQESSVVRFQIVDGPEILMHWTDMGQYTSASSNDLASRFSKLVAILDVAAESEKSIREIDITEQSQERVPYELWK